MPSINKVRVSNVVFDHDSRFYDNIVIPVNDGRLLIEAENGSGKTLLMQCILQAVKPGLYFHRKNSERSEQPTIRHLFKSNNNTTIHSMIEWTLDEGSEYDYMLTGFCAKKINKETEEGVKVDIESFNYVILYNADSPFSLESIPLKVEKNHTVERMSFSQLKKYLNELSNREKKCLVRMFSKKSVYEAFLNSFNINSSEFELMRLINLKEGGSEEYFTESYKTSYDFIVGEIVERIESVDKMIQQDSFKSKEDLAKSLFDIKSTMEELQHKQNKVNEIDIAETYFYKLMDVNDRLITELELKEETFKDISKGLNSQLKLIHNIESKILEIESNKLSKLEERDDITRKSEANDSLLNTLEEQIESFKKELEQIKEFKEILRRRKEKETLLTQVKEYEETLISINTRIANILNTATTINENIDAIKKEKEIKEIENIYVEYLDITEIFNTLEKEFELKSKDIQGILDEERKTQGYLVYALNTVIESLKEEVSNINTNINSTKKELIKISQEKQDNTIKINTNKNTLSSYQDKVKQNNEQIKKETDYMNVQNDTFTTLENDKITIIDNTNVAMESLTTTDIDTHELCNGILNLGSRIGVHINESGILGVVEDNQNHIKNLDHLANNFINNNIDKINHLESLDLRRDLEKTIQPLRDNLKNLENDKDTTVQEIDELKRSIKNTNATISSTEDSLAEFYDETEGLSDLLKKYSAGDRFTLENILDDTVDEIRKDLFKIESAIENTKSTVDEMERNKGISISKDTKSCYDILSKAYSSTILGISFYENLAIEEKEFYLSASNLIPIGIILNNTDFNSLLNNKNLLEKIDNFFVPIINIDKIKEGIKATNEVVFINSKDKSFYINEEKRKLQIEELKKELLTLKKEESLLQNNLTERNYELDIVSKVNHLYSSNFEVEQKELIKELLNEVNECEKEILEFENKLHQIKEELLAINNEIELHTKNTLQKIEDIKKEIQDLNKSNNNLNIFRNQLGEIKSLLLKLENTHIKQLTAYENTINSKNAIINLNNEVENLTTSITLLNEENSKLEENNTNLEIQINKLEATLDNLNLEKNKITLNLNKQEADLNDIKLIPTGTKAISSEKSIIDLKNDLDSIRRNKVKQGGDIDLLQKQIETNRKLALNKKEDINTGVISFEELELKKNTIKKNERIVFEELNNRLLKLEEELKNNTDRLNKEEKNKHYNEAHIEQTISRINDIDTQDHVEIPKDYNTEDEEKRVNNEISRINKEIKETRTNRKLLSKKLTTISDELSNIESLLHQSNSDLTNLVTQKEKIETVMENNNILSNEELGFYDKGTFDVKLYESRIKKHYWSIEKVTNLHKALRTECLEKLKDTSFNIIKILDIIEAKSEIADVIEQNIKIETDCLSILKNTKEHLSVELEQLNELKDSFIEKCLTRTENLLIKIKKLQKLATIEVDGEKRPLIKVNLNELDSENKKIKMKNHIEFVLGQIDTKITSEENTNQNEKISRALSSSKLLEQVILSPKRCEVKIYVPKNEEGIISNGHYVNWGGTASGGQRNVMYLIVSIAMLLFIRELSTVGTASKQTKVLYVDGAFKASASIYLWECICPLLVDNNIQLIVTNKGTPAPLMKMFDSVALLVEHKKQIGNKIITENKIGQKSYFKTDTRTLKGENILHNFGEYRIPKKEVVENISDNEQISF